MSTFNDTDMEIELMTTFSRQAFEASQKVVVNMKDGERIQIKQLAQSVGLAMSKDTKVVLGFVDHFAHHTTLAYVTRGKNGGLVKGTRPVKIAKVSKKAKATDTSVTVVDTANS